MTTCKCPTGLGWIKGPLDVQVQAQQMDEWMVKKVRHKVRGGRNGSGTKRQTNEEREKQAVTVKGEQVRMIIKDSKARAGIKWVS